MYPLYPMGQLPASTLDAHRLRAERRARAAAQRTGRAASEQGRRTSALEWFRVLVTRHP